MTWLVALGTERDSIGGVQARETGERQVDESMGVVQSVHLSVNTCWRASTSEGR